MAFDLTMYCPVVTGRSRLAPGMELFRWLLSPHGPREMRPNWKPARGYACDNGAWTCHKAGIPFDDDLYRRFLELRGEGADWVVVPDRVGDMQATLEMFEAWLPELDGLPLMLALQDGMKPADVAAMAPRLTGLFLGGTTEYKLASMRMWGDWSLEQGLLLHVARVNTIKRIRLCEGARAHSCDGSSVVHFPSTIAKLTGYVRERKRQVQLFGGMK